LLANRVESLSQFTVEIIHLAADRHPGAWALSLRYARVAAMAHRPSIMLVATSP
jgi:hypothetical protein